MIVTAIIICAVLILALFIAFSIIRPTDEELNCCGGSNRRTNNGEAI